MERAIRATDATQKAERRAQLLLAAREGFRAHGYAGLTMARVARRAGVAKGTLYLSFPTKEALFLGVLEEEFQAWCEATTRELARLRRPTPDRVAGVLADGISRQALFRDLVALMHQVLEQNIPRADAEIFKRKLLGLFLGLSRTLGGVVPGLGTARAGRFLLRTQALVVGLQGMAKPAPVVAAILKGPEWAPLRVDFDDELRRALQDLLRGMMEES